MRRVLELLPSCQKAVFFYFDTERNSWLEGNLRLNIGLIIGGLIISHFDRFQWCACLTTSDPLKKTTLSSYCGCLMS